MKNKKRIIIIALSIIVIAIAGIIGAKIAKNKKDNEMIDVTIKKWNKKDDEYVICRVARKDYNIESDMSTDLPCFYFHAPGLTREDIKKRDDYVGTIDYYNAYGGCDMENVDILFSDNNYIGLYEYEDGIYYAFNMMSEIHEGKSMFITTPMTLGLYTWVGDNEIDNIPNHEKTENFFKTFTFDYLCKFYGRLDEKYANIDKENQIIKVSGCFTKNYKIFENAVTIDYANKTLTMHYPDHEDMVYE